jgi:3-hydroxyisobutyrate dehydrogenase
MSTVGVVGLGRMGSRLARRLLDAGHEVVVWNRSPEPIAELTVAGAAAATSPAEVARRCEAVVTMLTGPEALRAVTEAADGIAAGVGDETTMIDMSTIGPDAVDWLRGALPAATGLLDAPVLGSLTEVESGSLTVFIGGPDPLVERWTPLLETFGTPLHVGPLGAGAEAKLVANSTLVGVIGVLGETLALADALGLSREATWQVLAVTPLAAQAERRRAVVETGQAPVRFSLSLARKDADLIVEALAAKGYELRIAQAARSWLVEAEEAGLGDEDYSAVLAHMLGR